ncbi:sugar-binding transcriptional regulator [Clostridium thermarum]|uniref:sugar-binding transcriptional regulator n=1 Tax=Clostridium thermarum TaxID=1716543 RepID=UPI00111E5353|nr:sugar-binding domain-containing protein [Clostridium thermarum]
MDEILKLQQKIVPELIELLEKRYNILRTIYYNQPVGRRILANSVNLGERIVRTEINFLKSVNLIEVSAPGMIVTAEGENIIDKLKGFIHEIKGLSDIEDVIAEKLNVKKVIIVPGNMDEDRTVVKELGRAAANYIKGVIKSGDIIALTGGSTIKEVIDNVPKMHNIYNALVVPARGGMGKQVEIQANTLAANLANKIGGSYKLLHIPDNISDRALDTMLNERDIKDIIENIKNSNVLIYGIGRADEMAKRRGVTPEMIDKLTAIGTVGEAFGCYFNKDGEVVYSTPTVGINSSDIRRINYPVAVAGGSSKAEAILATEKGNKSGVLITDEGAAKEILRLIKEYENSHTNN